jgi:mannose-1-phosphate guanylyltransferase
MSRQLYPKQFIPLIGEQSLFQKTLERVAGLPGRESPITVCNEGHRFMAAEQLRQAGEDGALIMLEPAGRNTAPAIAVAALEVLERHGDGVMLVLPADHIVNDRAAFRGAAIDGMKAAISG